MKSSGNGTPEQCAVNLLLITRGEVPYNSVASWTGYAMHFDAHNSIKSIWKLFNNLFVWRRDFCVHQDL